jgi:hypothetical protein
VLRARSVLLAPLAVAIVVTAAAAALPLYFASRNAPLHIAIETANELIAIVAFPLVTGRLRSGVVLSDVLLAVALALLALTNLMFSTVPAAANDEYPSTFAAWTPLLGRLVGGSRSWPLRSCPRASRPGPVGPSLWPRG